MLDAGYRSDYWGETRRLIEMLSVRATDPRGMMRWIDNYFSAYMRAHDDY
jgi:hypothetical protein